MRVLLFGGILTAFCAGAAPATPYLDAVIAHAERFIAHGHDRYGPRHTPLFVDGLDVRTMLPAEWIYGGKDGNPLAPYSNKISGRDQQPGERWILSDLANQQDFFRVLVALANLTGRREFLEEAERALAYGMRELRSRSGLLYWGGHIAYDCSRDIVVAEQTEHELKCQFPFYPLMARVDRRKTLNYVEAFWEAHVLDWRSLDMNRHGDEFFRKPPRLRMWARPYRPPAVPFDGRGRSFANTASDLIAAAVFFYQSDGNRRALGWAKRLGQRYADARHPVTGIGGRQFTSTPDDRARAQFGAQFGTVASDANILGPAMAVFRYARMPLCFLTVSENLGPREGTEFQRWAIEDLLTFGKHVYDADHNMVYPMFVDGRRIDLKAVKRAGHYYDPAHPGRNTKLKPYRVGGVYFWAFAKAYRISGDAQLLGTLRQIGKRNGLGDVMAAPQLGHREGDPDLLHGLLELHRATGEARHLALARRTGDNILKDRRQNGLLVRSRLHRYSRCSAPEALALLHLHAALADGRRAVPQAWPSYPYFQCSYGDLGRTTDNTAIYKAKIDGTH